MQSTAKYARLKGIATVCQRYQCDKSSPSPSLPLPSPEGTTRRYKDKAEVAAELNKPARKVGRDDRGPPYLLPNLLPSSFKTTKRTRYGRNGRRNTPTVADTDAASEPSSFAFRHVSRQHSFQGLLAARHSR